MVPFPHSNRGTGKYRELRSCHPRLIDRERYVCDVRDRDLAQFYHNLRDFLVMCPCRSEPELMMLTSSFNRLPATSIDLTDLRGPHTRLVFSESPGLSELMLNASRISGTWPSPRVPTQFKFNPKKSARHSAE